MSGARRRRFFANLVLRLFLSDVDRLEAVESLELLRSERVARGGLVRPAVWYWWELSRYPFTLGLLALGDALRRRRRPRPAIRVAGGLGEWATHDVWHAARALRRTPVVTTVAVATIALAIGVNTGMFSFADALLLRPLPFPEAERLVALYHVTRGEAASYSSFSYPDYVELREQADVFSGLAARSTIDMELGSGAARESLEGEIVSSNYFTVLGVRPLAGRTFLPEEDRTPGTHPVVVLGQTLWESRFGADTGIIGQSITLNGRQFTVNGVVPPSVGGLQLQSTADFWIPLMMQDVAMPDFRAFGLDFFRNRGTHWLDLLGRLADGQELQQAGVVLRGIAERQAAAYPETNADWTIAVWSAGDARLGPPPSQGMTQLTAMLAAVVGIVLLIACANIANLLLARSAPRRREMAVRSAIGAGRARLVRLLLTEALLLSLLGGAIGVVLAVVSQDLFSSVGGAADLPGLELRLDLRMITFAAALSVLTGVGFGIVPALQTSAADVTLFMRESPCTGPGPDRLPIRQLLVVAQVSMCVVLLVGAGLTLTTLWNLRAVPLGYEAENLWTLPIDLSNEEYTENRGRVVYDRLLERVRAFPGVESASLALITPFSAGRMANDVMWETPDADHTLNRTNVDMNLVGVDWFGTMKIPVVRGRAFTEQDGADAPSVALVNESMAERLWPEQDPIGRTLWYWNPNGPDRRLEVVGVVRNGRYYRGWRSAEQAFLFLSIAQNYHARLSLHIRGVPGWTPGATLRETVQQVDPHVHFAPARAVTNAMSEAITLERTTARLLGMFALLALSIAAIGVYGVVSFSVTERTHEIGLRMALGARPGDTVRAVVARSSRSVLAGTMLGTLVALGLSRYLSGLLFGVSPTDPTIFALVSVVLIGTGVLASWVPARRVTTIDPLLALRSD